jgi:hypothetical protein
MVLMNLLVSPALTLVMPFAASAASASAAAAAAADGSKLILGGSSLSVWDMSAQQRISKLTGHPVSRQHQRQLWQRHPGILSSAT